MDSTYALGSGDQAISTAYIPEGVAYVLGDSDTVPAGTTMTGNDTITGDAGTQVGILGDAWTVQGPGTTMSGDDVLSSSNGGMLVGDSFDVIGSPSADPDAPQDTASYGNDILTGDANSQFIVGDSVYVRINASSSGDDQIAAGAGSDTVLGDAQMIYDHSSSSGDDQISGGDQMDFITGDNLGVYTNSTSTGNDRIQGDDGNDSIIGDNYDLAFSAQSVGNDILEGGADNDTLIGDNFSAHLDAVSKGNDYLSGGDGNDMLVGDCYYLATNSASSGRDILVGGAGDDTLWGGSAMVDTTSQAVGADIFVYDFQTLTTQLYATITYTETFDAWLSQAGLQAGSLTQSQFSSQYGAWLNHLVAEYADEGLGADTNGDGVISVGLNQNDPAGLPSVEGLTGAQVDGFFSDTQSITVKTGKTTQTRSYSDEFGFETTVLVGSNTWVYSQDGHDVIKDFTAGSDMLRFQADAFTSFDPTQYFAVEVGDFTGDAAVDTRVILASEAGTDPAQRSWSVTLSGVDLGGEDLSSYVTFGETRTVEDWPMA